ncbi:MAG: hypothetical protein C4K60_04305 [Ideonella sp. MAG2]|nr:MAG: hypothetical protein C4K60_04305 [Ideonella sp. MAG2]
MDETPQVVLNPEREGSLRTLGMISYLLHAVVAVGAVVPGFQPSILLLVVAFFIDLFKKDEARGTWQESHFNWRIRSVLWAFGLYIITSPLYLLLVFPGMVAWFIVSLWFLYRVARGWLALNDRRAMPV